MAMPAFADPANLVPSEIEDGPEGETSLELLQTVYRDRKQPLSVRVRCAIEALVHEYPKMSAVQVSHMNGQDFASALERAIARSRGETPALLSAPKVIEHDEPTIEHSPSEMKKPMARYRRF
jgi:hypothetical protein